MWERIGRKFDRLTGDTGGTEIAEAALVLPITFMLLIGVFWFGQAFSIYGTITHAARQGARAGAAPSCATCAAGNTPGVKACNAVQTAFSAAHLDSTKVNAPTAIPSLISCSTGAAVTTCDPGNPTGCNVCIQQGVQLSDGVSGTNVCGVSVSFQYPYQFWFPGTSLNKQLIQLRAVARMRMEKQ